MSEQPFTGNTVNSELQNPKFDEQGKNERKSLSNASQALQIARRLERDDDKRDIERARVLAAFNGAAPYDQCELEAVGQSYRFNVSFGFMEGVIGRATVPYTELVNDTQYVANIDGVLSEDKLIIMREELSEILRQWGRWAKFTSRLIQDLVLNGYNTCIFPSDYDPWPIFIQQKDSFVPEMTGNDVGDLDLFVWKKSYLIHELYAYIEDEKTAKAAGWNIENTRKAIENATPEDVYQRNRGGTWTAIESAIRGGALWSSIVGEKKIETYHILASELDGTVTHYIVSNGKRADGNVNQEDAELFKREKRWPSMRDVLVYFDLEAGDGKWHGSRGIGRRSFNTHRSIDKLRCSLLDQAFTSGLTILQASDQDSQEAFQLAVVGPFAVIPAGINVNATTVPAISATTFQVDALLSSTSEQRIGDIVPNTSSPTRHGTKTATEAEISNDRNQMISKTNLTRFLDPLSHLISNIVLRLLKKNSPDPYAQRFQKKLMEKGFSRDDFAKVRGASSTGRIDAVLGNDANNMDKLLMAYRGDVDIDQKELKRRHLAAIIGPKDLEGLLIEGEDKTKEIEATRDQVQEIDVMLDGLPQPVSPRDLHEVHAAIATDWLKGQAQRQVQGQKGASLQTIEAVLAHAANHVDEMSKDPSMKQSVKQLEETLKEVSTVFRKIKEFAMKAAQQQQQQAGAPAPGGGAPPQSPPRQEPPKGPNESINFKDLPPEGKVQMAAKAGIRIAPPAPEPQPVGAA